MAAGKDYFSIGEYEVSQDNRLLAWAQDDVGRRQYTIHFRTLETGQTYPDVITGVSAHVVWAHDNRNVFYVEQAPAPLLPVRLKTQVLDNPSSDEPTVGKN